MFYNIYTTPENNKSVIFAIMNSLGFNMTVKSNDNECIRLEVKDDNAFKIIANNLQAKGLILNLF